MKAKQILPALLAAFTTIPASALTWNDAGPTNNWSTAVGNTNWTGGVTWTNGSAADFTGAGETVTLATAAMTAGTVNFSAGAYTLNTNGNSMAWNALAGTAGFTKSGAGTLTINGTGGASGTINLTGGQITVGGTTALGTTSIAADGGSTVLAANGYNIANAVSLANGAKLSTTAGSTVSSSISLGAGGGNLSGGAGNYGIFTGKITGGTAGTNSLTINAGHTELKNTANDFAGNILLSGGFYLKTTISESLPDNAIINFTNANAAYKIQPGSAGTYTETIGGINSAVGAFGVFAEGSVPGVIVNLRVGAGDATSSYNGPIFQVGVGVLNFEKIGAGTFTSAGTNTYTGNTTVNAGTLAVTRSLGATAVTVNSPATLAGNGNIGGNVTIASGAHHALAVAATTGAQITRAITGTLTMTDSILDLTAASTPAAGVYVLATATTAITGTPATINYNAISGTVSVDTVSSPHRLLLTVSGSPYDTWANGTFANPFTNKLPTANPDADGQTNQQEFAFGLDPTTGSSVNPITQQLAGGVFKYTRTKDSGLIYKVYYSTALSSWTWDEFATQSPSAAVAGVETVTVTLAAAAPIDGKLFVRVEAAPAP